MVYKAEIWYNHIPSVESPTGCQLHILDVGWFRLTHNMARVLGKVLIDAPGVSTGWTPREIEIGLGIVIT